MTTLRVSALVALGVPTAFGMRAAQGRCVPKQREDLPKDTYLDGILNTEGMGKVREHCSQEWFQTEENCRKHSDGMCIWEEAERVRRAAQEAERARQAKQIAEQEKMLKEIAKENARKEAERARQAKQIAQQEKILKEIAKENARKKVLINKPTNNRKEKCPAGQYLNLQGGSKIYWEPQCALRCSLHSINSAVQSNKFSKDEMNATAEKLASDQAMRPDYYYSKEKYYGGYPGNGYQKGLWAGPVILDRLTKMYGQNVVYTTNQNDMMALGMAQADQLNSATAILVGKGNHWYTLRRIRTHSGKDYWYNLDSLHSKEKVQTQQPMTAEGVTAHLRSLIPREAIEELLIVW